MPARKFAIFPAPRPLIRMKTILSGILAVAMLVGAVPMAFAQSSTSSQHKTHHRSGTTPKSHKHKRNT